MFLLIKGGIIIKQATFPKTVNNNWLVKNQNHHQRIIKSYITWFSKFWMKISNWNYTWGAWLKKLCNQRPKPSEYLRLRGFNWNREEF